LRLATELHGDEVAQAIQLHQLHMAYAPGACQHRGRVNEGAGGQYMTIELSAKYRRKAPRDCDPFVDSTEVPA
jgi:hypothetical protein